MKSPAFQLYAADIYMDTNEWTAEAVGIYTRLLFHQWVNGSIPKDIKKLSQIALVSIKILSKRWPEIESKFIFDESLRGRNIRLEETRQKQLQYSEMQRQKGIKRSEKMWEGHIAAAIPPAINRLQPEALPKDSSSSSTSNKPPISPKRGMAYTDGFLSFWSAYPKKVGKDAAWASWQKRNGDRPPTESLLTAINAQILSPQWQKEKGQFIPNPSTWINQGRWADETENIKKESW